MLLEELRKQWNARGSHAPLHAALGFVDDWLVLGAGTRLAKARNTRSPAGSSDSNDDARIARLLSAAYERPLEPRALRHIRRALVKHREGDTTLALMHSAMTGLWPLKEPRQAAYRLFMADGLMRAGLAPRELVPALDLYPPSIGRFEKYAPDQPRVPAGNGRPSGRWTRDGALGTSTSKPSPESETRRDEGSGGGTHASPKFSSTVRWPIQPREIVSDAQPDSLKPGEQYAAANGADEVPEFLDPRVGHANEALMGILRVVAGSVPAGVGSRYGIALHVAFAAAVRAAGLTGIGSDDVEQSFNEEEEVKYGTDGSVRTDVTLWDGTHENVIAIFDLKTGRAKLTEARIQQLKAAVPKGGDVPIIELRVDFW